MTYPHLRSRQNHGSALDVKRPGFTAPGAGAAFSEGIGYCMNCGNRLAETPKFCIKLKSPESGSDEPAIGVRDLVNCTS
jgi:hypothetical protein